MPGVPYLYFGDEIGMHTNTDLPSFEGGYQRTGSRTPMRWDHSKNAGFSKADHIFLPTNENDSTLEDQLKDPNSLWHVVHQLIELRKQDEDLRSDDFTLLDGRMAYMRGKDFIAINLLDQPQEFPIDEKAKIRFQLGGVSLNNGKLILQPHAGAIVR
jgi:maltose alpha-D-glucosyltransferase/alpha-amylase